MKHDKRCCICGKKIQGFGNDPWGALGISGRPIRWHEDDECCDECNSKHVIPGRIAMMMKKRSSD